MHATHTDSERPAQRQGIYDEIEDQRRLFDEQGQRSVEETRHLIGSLVQKREPNLNKQRSLFRIIGALAVAGIAALDRAGGRE